MKRIMEDSFERRLALTLVVSEINEDRYVVSTVELPAECYGSDICETMVFTESDWNSGELIDRYSLRSKSKVEACQTHNRICEALEMGEYEWYNDEFLFMNSE